MPKISQLPTDSSPTLTDYVPVLDQETTTTKRSLLSSIRDLMFNNIPSSSSIVTGWQPLTQTASVSTGYNKGNREFDVTFSSTMANTLSPGMKLKFTRGTSPGTQCTDLERSSNQYANRATGSVSGITFTDDFSIEAWVKLESYNDQVILSRQTAANGWLMYTDATGQVLIQGVSGSTTEGYATYTSLPLNRWVHVAGTLDLSGNSCVIYIDGYPQANRTVAGSLSSLTQAGDLQIGAYNGATLPFDGKISDVRLWNAVRTETQIRDNMNQQLVGNETNLVGYWKLDGNFNDSTSNGNNLTAQGSATATNSDNPFSTTEYAVVKNVNTTTVTVYTGYANNIPNMTLSSPYYSMSDSPLSLPQNLKRIFVGHQLEGNSFSTTAANGAYADIPGLTSTFTVPTGGRKYRATLLLPSVSSNTGAPPLIIIALRDGNNVVFRQTQTQPSAANIQAEYVLSGDIYLPAGSATIKASIYINQSPVTATCNASAGMPMELIVEELG